MLDLVKFILHYFLKNRYKGSVNLNAFLTQKLVQNKIDIFQYCTYTVWFSFPKQFYVIIHFYIEFSV